MYTQSVTSFLLVVLATFGTFYDLRANTFEKNKKRHEILQSFSLRRNFTNFFDLDQSKHASGIRCLHGIRVLSMLSIISLHTYFFRVFTPFKGSEALQEFMQTSLALTISALHILVEPFFVTSALLFTRSMLKALDS